MARDEKHMVELRWKRTETGRELEYRCRIVQINELGKALYCDMWSSWMAVPTVSVLD